MPNATGGVRKYGTTGPDKEMSLQLATNITYDLVQPTIVMDGLSAKVQLLAAPAQLEGDGEAPIRGHVILTGHWDGRSMSCDFLSEQTYTAPPSIEPTRLEIRDRAQNSISAIKVGKPFFAGLQPTLFGDEFKASLVPHEEHVHVVYDRENRTIKRWSPTY